MFVDNPIPRDPCKIGATFVPGDRLGKYAGVLRFSLVEVVTLGSNDLAKK